MKLESWTRYLVAAALVLLVGAAWVLAEEKTMRVEVRTEDGQEMTIDVNGVTEVIQLEDLADGEERIYDVGGHEVTVKRVGESLSLVHDGPMSGRFDGDHHDRLGVRGRQVGHGIGRVACRARAARDAAHTLWRVFAGGYRGLCFVTCVDVGNQYAHHTGVEDPLYRDDIVPGCSCERHDVRAVHRLQLQLQIGEITWGVLQIDDQPIESALAHDLRSHRAERLQETTDCLLAILELLLDEVFHEYAGLDC